MADPFDENLPQRREMAQRGSINAPPDIRTRHASRQGRQIKKSRLGGKHLPKPKGPKVLPVVAPFMRRAEMDLRGSPPVGRLEVLKWINAFVGTDYVKIEHLCDGIAYCRIFNKLHPGTLQMKRLMRRAKYQEHFLRNLGVLKTGLHRCGVNKDVPIKRLANGRFQDNYEFAQWSIQYVYKWARKQRQQLQTPGRRGSPASQTETPTPRRRGRFSAGNTPSPIQSESPAKPRRRTRTPVSNLGLERKAWSKQQSPPSYAWGEAGLDPIQGGPGSGSRDALPAYYGVPKTPSTLVSNEYRDSENAILSAQRQEVEAMLQQAESDLRSRLSQQGRALAKIQLLKSQRDGLFSKLCAVEQAVSLPDGPAPGLLAKRIRDVLLASSRPELLQQAPNFGSSEDLSTLRTPRPTGSPISSPVVSPLVETPRAANAASLDTLTPSQVKSPDMPSPLRPLAPPIGSDAPAGADAAAPKRRENPTPSSLAQTVELGRSPRTPHKTPTPATKSSLAETLPSARKGEGRPAALGASPLAATVRKTQRSGNAWGSSSSPPSGTPGRVSDPRDSVTSADFRIHTVTSPSSVEIGFGGSGGAAGTATQADDAKQSSASLSTISRVEPEDNLAMGGDPEVRRLLGVKSESDSLRVAWSGSARMLTRDTDAPLSYLLVTPLGISVLSRTNDGTQGLTLSAHVEHASIACASKTTKAPGQIAIHLLDGEPGVGGALDLVFEIERVRVQSFCNALQVLHKEASGEFAPAVNILTHGIPSLLSMVRSKNAAAETKATETKAETSQSAAKPEAVPQTAPQPQLESKAEGSGDDSDATVELSPGKCSPESRAADASLARTVRKGAAGGMVSPLARTVPRKAKNPSLSAQTPAVAMADATTPAGPQPRNLFNAKSPVTPSSPAEDSQWVQREDAPVAASAAGSEPPAPEEKENLGDGNGLEEGEGETETAKPADASTPEDAATRRIRGGLEKTLVIRSSKQGKTTLEL